MFVNDNEKMNFEYECGVPVEIPLDLTRIRYGRTAGVPNSRSDIKCAQIQRQNSQAIAIAEQQFPPTQTCIDVSIPTKSEQNIFANDIKVDFDRSAKDLVPIESITKSGFFELAIPPPNPMLLSNVSAERLFSLSESFASDAGPARSSIERQLKNVIAQTIQHQAQALMTISDLRHSISGLQQRVVEARAYNQGLDIGRANNRIRLALDSIEKLRDLIRAVQERRQRALEELKGPLTEEQFGRVQTVVANQLKLMEANVRQYHAQPADGAIEAFRRPHFQADAGNGAGGYVMKKGFYDYPEVGGIGNNKLQSLKIGDKTKVVLYERPKRGGKSLTYIGPRRVTQLPTMWTSAVSGIEIIETASAVVEVWDAPFYQGASVRLPIGFYDYPNVGGIKAGKTSSLSIPDGIHVTVYSRQNKGGEKITFIGPQRVPFLPADWNAKVFGMEITLA